MPKRVQTETVEDRLETLEVLLRRVLNLLGQTRRVRKGVAVTSKLNRQKKEVAIQSASLFGLRRATKRG